MSRQYKFGTSIPNAGASGADGEQTVSGIGIYVGDSNGTGSIGAVLQDGTSLSFKNVPAGILPVAVRGIHGCSR